MIDTHAKFNLKLNQIKDDKIGIAYNNFHLTSIHSKYVMVQT